MFERYTEKARRVIFFARYEASQFGSPYIETEHLLLGILREDKALASRLQLSQDKAESIRNEIEAHTQIREKVSTSVDLPLSNESKRVLAYAAEEAGRMGHKHIGSEHLLLGLLREEQSFAAKMLHDRGLRLSYARKELSKAQQAEVAEAGAMPAEGSLLARFSVDLTKRAAEQQLKPMIGRKQELADMIRVLGCMAKSNPVLVGKPGVGRETLADMLALRIAEGSVPAFLQSRTVRMVDLQGMIAAAGYLGRLGEFLRRVTNELWGAERTIFYLEGFYALLAQEPPAGTLNAGEILKTPLREGLIQCICSATPQEYRAATERNAWLSHCFRVVEVQAPTHEETFSILQARKEGYEKFHFVQLADDVLKYAVLCAAKYVHDRAMPEVALDLIDEAAAAVKAQRPGLPEEIVEQQKRLQKIMELKENAITNHEFEKARFYAGQEREEEENLCALMEKHKIDQSAAGAVTLEVVEQVLARWTGLTPEAIRQGANGSLGE